MKSLKIMAGVLTAVLGLVVAALPASANGGSLAVAIDKTKVEVNNINLGAVDNFLFTKANTGKNETIDGSSDTGNADAEANVSNGVNSSSTYVKVSSFEVGPVALNLNTSNGYEADSLNGGFWFFGGPGAFALDITKVKVDNLNVGYVGNMVFTIANTGKNQTFGGSSDTGNAEAEANVSTTLNTNSTSIEVNETGVGPIAVNAQIGEAYPYANGGSLALALEWTSVKVNNINLGAVNNTVMTIANTGKNETIDGSSDTGNADSDSTVRNTVNTNETNVKVSDSSVGPIAANVNTSNGYVGDSNFGGGYAGLGPVAANVNTDGTAVAVNATTVSVNNLNEAEVSNSVITVANTGGNSTSISPTPTAEVDSSHQEGSDTGNAEAESTVSNNVNSNSTTVVVSN